MINTAEVLRLNEMLKEMDSHEAIRKKLFIDLYGVKYIVLGVQSIEQYENDSFITVIKIGLCDAHNQIIREYSLPVPESKLSHIAGSIKSAYNIWERRVK